LDEGISAKGCGAIEIPVDSNEEPPTRIGAIDATGKGVKIGLGPGSARIRRESNRSTIAVLAAVVASGVKIARRTPAHAARAVCIAVGGAEAVNRVQGPDTGSFRKFEHHAQVAITAAAGNAKDIARRIEDYRARRTAAATTLKL